MKKIYIEKNEKYTRIAIKKGNHLEELFIEEEKEGPYVGKIYKGVVKNLLNGNKSIFVDIGMEKNAYMHFKDLDDMNIKKGDHIIVEILKEGVGNKGPKVTSEISIQGHYCVLVTFNNKINYSKKIEDVEFKKNIYRNLKKPKDIGIIIRSKAVDASLDELNYEIEYLYDTYLKIIKSGTYSLKPKLLYDNGSVIYKFLRNYLDENIEEIITNSKEYYDYAIGYIKNINKYSVSVKLYTEEENLFSYYDIEKDIVQLRNSKVNLPCGGYIVIDKTEAMYAIDVNTGKNIKHESMRKTVLNTNLEAAYEIAKQIKLRNLGGIIVVDFIDMHYEEDKIEVISLMQEAFKEDKNNTKIYPFTQLGLMQITRKRVGKDIYSYIEESCGKCHGSGKRMSLDYILFLIRNDIYKMEKQWNVDNVYIEIDEEYKKNITEDILSFIKNIDALNKKVYVKYTNNSEIFKVEPLMFNSQIKKLETCKVYG